MFRFIHQFVTALAVLALSSISAQANQGPLAPEIAFPVSAKVQHADSATVSIDIVDEYYVYHEKISVSSNTPGVVVGALDIPPGKIKTDQYFGEMETHRGKLDFTVMLSERPSAATTVELAVKSQGCADLGICYPPLTQVVSVDLPAKSDPVASLPFVNTLSANTFSAGSASASMSSSVIANTNSTFDFGSLEVEDVNGPIPDPTEAFTVELMQGANGIPMLAWTIDPTTYLYKHKFEFELTGTRGSLQTPAMPKGKEQHDEFFGDVEVYRNDALIHLPYNGDISGGKLNIKYQGCADAGICYLPQQMALTLPENMPVAAEASADATPKTLKVASTTNNADTAPVSEQDRLTATVRDSNFALVLLAFFGLGLLLAFTPCVFPMIPILSGIIVGQGEEISTRKALGLSAVYVLAMALTYTILGVLIGLSGENIQIWFQTPWVLYTFAAMFIALSFSMFGFYELQMPSAIQSKLTNLSNSQNGGNYAGVGIMGFLSALIVGPCVTAPLMAVLVYIAESGDAVKGGLVLFSLSLGMGAPLLVIGASAGKLLPRAGAWMDAVKSVFGVLMIGMAIWMLERILPATIILAMTATLLIVSSVYMGALRTPAEGKSGWHQLWRGLGLVLLIYGSLLLVGAASGSKSLLKPLASISNGVGGATQVSDELHFQMVDSIEELDNAVAAANASGKPVMFDFYADWCVSCKEMEAFTFTDPAVQTALSNFVLLQVDVTDNTKDHQALTKRYGLFGPPAILFFGKDGEEQRGRRVVGFMKAEPFANNVHGVI